MELHVATRKGFFVYALDGGRATLTGRHFIGDNVSMSHSDQAGSCWLVALDHGHFGVKVHRSRDRGATWAEVAAPAYPKRAEGAPEEIGADGRPWPWSLKRIWSLESAAGMLWCGTIPGGLFVSRDDGDRWSLVEALWNHPDRRGWFGGGADHPGIHSICIDPRDARTVRVAVSCGGAWTTSDGGASWRNTSKGMFATYMPPEQRENPNIQDPHRMAQCRSDPDRLWIQHHNGVFRSVDGGEHWRHCADVPPCGNGFGFAVAVHPEDGDTAWLVPAVDDQHRVPPGGRVVVSRTRDGGRSWQELRHGLPQQDAYDLVYRHALDVAGDGRTLAIGSTTGALWVSGDGGDGWQLLSAHLPPVHAVRLVDAAPH